MKRIIACALVAIAPLAIADAAAGKPKGKLKPRTFRMEIKGEQLTTWNYIKQMQPKCDWPEYENARQYISFNTARFGPTKNTTRDEVMEKFQIVKQVDRVGRMVDALEFVDLALPTGLGEGRNLLIVRMADAVVAVGGSWGTLAEIALARRRRTPVVSVMGWVISGPGADDDLVRVEDAAAAVRIALDLSGEIGTDAPIR